MEFRAKLAIAAVAAMTMATGCVEEEPDKPYSPPTGGSNDVCGEFPLETGTKVLFVLDKSGSMFTTELPWDHDDDPDTPDIERWRSLYRVVELVVEGFDDRLSLGALLFPSGQGGCDVNQDPEIPIAANNGATLLAELPGPDDNYDPSHLTPLAEALQNGLDYLLGFDEEDSKAIILVSDGTPSPECDGGLTEAAQIAATSWEDHGIPVFVVGIAIEQTDGQDFALLAEAGGHPEPNTGFYDTQDEAQLEAAMAEIADAIPDCNIKLDETPTYPEMVDISLGGQNLTKLDACDGDGWRYIDDEFRLIELCGSACEALMAGENDILATYGCPEEPAETGA
jgi:hypothetical protein